MIIDTERPVDISISSHTVRAELEAFASRLRTVRIDGGWTVEFQRKLKRIERFLDDESENF